MNSLFVFAGEFLHPVSLDGETTCFTFVGEFDNLQTGLRFLLSSASFSSSFSVFLAACYKLLTSPRVPESSELKIKFVLAPRKFQHVCFGDFT